MGQDENAHPNPIPENPPVHKAGGFLASPGIHVQTEVGMGMAKAAAEGIREQLYWRLVSWMASPLLANKEEEAEDDG